MCEPGVVRLRRGRKEDAKQPALERRREGVEVICIQVVAELGEAKDVWKLRDEPDECNRYDHESSERDPRRNERVVVEQEKCLAWFAGMARVSTSEGGGERG